MSFLNNSIKILFLLIILFFLGCDFRIPQEWETPEWQFDLNIPLINEEYSMASIASDSNDIQIFAPDSTDFMVSINERIIEPGAVVTDESFFIIEESSLEFSLEGLINIENPNPMPEFPFSESITLDAFIPDSLLGYCIPKNLPEAINYIDTIDIDSLCDNFNDVDCLHAINYLTIGSGNNTFTVNNGFPFKINNMELNINSGNNNFISTSLSDIGSSVESDYIEFEDKNLECQISAIVSLQIDEQLESTIGSCDWTESLCEPYGGVWLDNGEVEKCYFSLTPLGPESCSEEYIRNAQWNQNNQECRLVNSLSEEFCAPPSLWDSNLEQCYIIFEFNSSSCQQLGFTWSSDNCYFSCDQEQNCCETIYQGIWDNGNCIYSTDGIQLSDGTETLTISNEIIIDNFESLNAEIRDCEIPESLSNHSIPLETDANISLIEGYIASVEHPDTNMIYIDLTNNLFTYIYGNINSPNLIDSSGNSLVIQIDTVNIGESFKPIELSNYIIKNLDGTPIDNLNMTFQINIPDQITTLDFDNPYGLSGNGVNIKTTSLEALKVNLNEFSSPDINMGSIASGLDGFELPFLSINLHVYNQISADMKLYLDLYGITGEDTLKIHIEPDIKFLDLLDPYSDTDSLTISFYQDTMSVVHKGNGISHDSPIKTVMDNKITDLSSYDIIDVSGYAIMDGDATLLPNKSLWGDIEITIQPLTFIIEDSDKFNFIASKFTDLAIMDNDIATKIDSGLISATIDMNLNNQLPFSGDLLMYISNNPDYFPFCIDSLITGSLDEQEVSDSCKTYIDDYLGCENVSVLKIYPNTDSSFVKHLDCITINNENHYYENLLNIKFIPPTLDGFGNVLDSVLTQQEIILDDEIYYFTKDTLQYLIPRFVFNSELDTITLQPNNSLNINSSIMFRLLSTGLLE